MKTVFVYRRPVPLKEQPECSRFTPANPCPELEIGHFGLGRRMSVDRGCLFGHLIARLCALITGEVSNRDPSPSTSDPCGEGLRPICPMVMNEFHRRRSAEGTRRREHGQNGRALQMILSMRGVALAKDRLPDD